MAGLEYAALKNLEHLKVQISWTGEDGSGRAIARSWVGLIESDFAVSGSASYSSPYESLADGLNKTIRNVSTTGAAIGELTGTQALTDAASSLASSKMQSLKQTINYWMSTERPTFPISFTMLNYRAGMDVGRDAWDLYAKLYPSQAAGGTMLRAPGGYVAEIGDGGTASKGTWSIRIGRYFQAFNLNLMSVDVSLSQKQVADSPSDIPRPLSATISATLTPVTLPDEATVKSYYVLGG